MQAASTNSSFAPCRRNSGRAAPPSHPAAFRSIPTPSSLIADASKPIAYTAAMTQPVLKKTSVLFIFITVLIDIIGLGIIIPVIPELIMELTGKDISHASLYGGWLGFTYALMQFFFAAVLGGISDRIGRRPVILFSLFSLGVDYLIMGFAR